MLTRDDPRRSEIRNKSELFALDYLEASGQTLTLFFIKHAPTDLTPAHIRIEGGRRVRDIRVTEVKLCRSGHEDLDDCIRVRLDKPGDASTYKLCVVELDLQGKPSLKPKAGFDPRYSCLEFSFQGSGEAQLDLIPTPCPPQALSEPEINYLAKDYTSFRQLILDRLSLLLPDWQERHVPDLGIALVELLAYVGDYLSYYQDAVATEAYLATARQRISLRRHARLVDYVIGEGCNARTWVHLEVDRNFVLPKGIGFIAHLNPLPYERLLFGAEDMSALPADSYLWFEPLDKGDIWVYEPHNTIRFYTWDQTECCLSMGATEATLCDGWMVPAVQQGAQTPPKRPRALKLKPGDVLVFAEVIDPRTGEAADANPRHRHPVRITEVIEDHDPLHDQPLLHIRWDQADALPFALCISTLSSAPQCKPLKDVSVALGNMVLVDHGRSVPHLEQKVPVVGRQGSCQDDDPSLGHKVAGPLKIRLNQPWLVFAEDYTSDGPASAALQQSPDKAKPLVKVVSRSPFRPPPGYVGKLEEGWEPHPDLMHSSFDDPHFVVEVDDQGFAHLRFGDGELGKAPEADHTFKVSYRVGGGPQGNVGADSIRTLVSKVSLSGSVQKVTNPLPAQGGLLPEPPESIRLMAPHAIHNAQVRAITPQDYARLAQKHPRVQRATAQPRWTGSWYEMQVAIDALGGSEVPKELLQKIERDLAPYRRIGHDVKVVQAQQVPLRVELKVCLKPGFVQGHVRAALLDRFSNRVLLAGKKGFFHPDHLSFGDGIYASQLVVAAQGVDGVLSAEVRHLARIGEPVDARVLADGVLRLGPFEVARLDNDPNFPENGVLELQLEGGR